MKSVMVSLLLIGICFSVRIYSMEEQDNAQVIKNALRAQQLYDKGQEVLSKMEMRLMYTCFAREDAYIFVATERNKANKLFCKSRERVQRVVNDQNADEVTKQSALDLEKKIDAIPWVSK